MKCEYCPNCDVRTDTGGKCRECQQTEKSKAVTHLSNINIRDEYGTPVDKFVEFCVDYDLFPKLDVCTNIHNKKCKKYFTLQDNALTKKWNEDFFMNPPYSKIYDFIKYAYEQHKKHDVTGLILTYSKTDTKWWHEFIENKAEVHFIKGRLKFNDEFGKITRYPAPYPSCWIIFRG